MPKWSKAPPALVELFAAALPDDPRAERRKMFGYPAAFVGGNMFAGVHQDDIVVRLPETDRAALLAKRGARVFEPMPGRPMKEYVALPKPMTKRRADTARWLRLAFDHVAAMPPKARR